MRHLGTPSRKRRIASRFGLGALENDNSVASNEHQRPRQDWQTCGQVTLLHSSCDAARSNVRSFGFVLLGDVLKADLHTHSGEDPCDLIPYGARTLIDRASTLGYSA